MSYWTFSSAVLEGLLYKESANRIYFILYLFFEVVRMT